MRVTVCQLPHHPHALEAAWTRLGPHLREQGSEWLLLPEFAGADPVWLAPDFDAAIWQQQVDRAAAWLGRLLGAAEEAGVEAAQYWRALGLAAAGRLFAGAET